MNDIKTMRKYVTRGNVEQLLFHNNNVVDFELDEDDEVADLDYLVSFENVDAKDKIDEVALELEEHLYIDVKTLVEQIDDQIDEGGALVTVDFYIDII